MADSPGGDGGEEDALRTAGESLAEGFPLRERWEGIPWITLLQRASLAAGGVFTFVLGIELLKASARLLLPTFSLLVGTAIRGPASALGFGWIVSYGVLSGSPVAAVALGLLDAGALDLPSAYFMVMGSRFGAAFIVIVIGLVAILRGGGREESLSMGVLSFLVTYSIYLPALLLGHSLLLSGRLAWVTLTTPAVVLDGVDRLFGPLVRGALAALPPGAVFALAFGSLYVGLSVFDRAFHRKEVEEVEVSSLHRLLEFPLFSFVLGAGITLLSTSVSLSLGMLVPLYLKGYLRRREVIPYIMGANITTFADTLLVAFLLNNTAATNLVLVAMLSVSAVSVVVLLGYRLYSRGVLWLFHWTFHNVRALGGFALLLVATPLLLLFI